MDAVNCINYTQSWILRLASHQRPGRGPAGIPNKTFWSHFSMTASLIGSLEKSFCRLELLVPVWDQSELESPPMLNLSGPKMWYHWRNSPREEKIKMARQLCHSHVCSTCLQSPISFRVILFHFAFSPPQKSYRICKNPCMISDQYNECQVAICVSWHCLHRIENDNITVMLSKALATVS